MVMSPLSPEGKLLFAELQVRLAEQLPQLLGESLADGEATLVSALFRLLPTTPLPLSPQDWRDVRSFGEALRGYDVCQPALWRLTGPYLAGDGPLTQEQRSMMIEKVLQRQSWQTVARTHGLNGRAEVLTALRKIYQSVLEECRSRGLVSPLV